MTKSNKTWGKQDIYQNIDDHFFRVNLDNCKLIHGKTFANQVKT